MRRDKRGCALALLLLLYAGFSYALYNSYLSETRSSVAMERNFYGTLTVFESDFSGSTILTLRHGQIDHGFQFAAEDPRRKWPVSYYASSTGVGVSVRALRRLAAQSPISRGRPPGGRPLDMGFVGLGAGIMSAWGRPGDRPPSMK